MSQPPARQHEKQQIRAEGLARRKRQPDKDELSRLICRRLAALPEYARAGVVMFYVELHDEVRMQPLLADALEEGKPVVVPYCVEDRIELFRLGSIDELAAGSFRIPEPRFEFRARPDRKARITQLDLVIVPGVAFDRQGGRIGYGRGYYDRLLKQARPDTLLVAPAFECQTFPRIPRGPHDVAVHKIITEKAVYQC